MSSWLTEIKADKRRIAVIILSLIGLFIALFIAFVIEKENNIPGCKIGETIDCGKVVTSQYGYFFNIPVSILSSFWFIAIIAFYLVDYYDDYLIAFLTLLGLASIGYFIFIELFILNTICLYCTSAHIVGLLIIILIGPKAIINSYNKLRIKYQQS